MQFAKLLEEDLVYSCFYDLSGAFDAMEFCVLLEKFFMLESKGSAGDWSGTCTRTSSHKLALETSCPNLFSREESSKIQFRPLFCSIIRCLLNQRAWVSVCMVSTSVHLLVPTTTTPLQLMLHNASNQVNTVDEFAKPPTVPRKLWCHHHRKKGETSFDHFGCPTHQGFCEMPGNFVRLKWLQPTISWRMNL